MADDPPAPVAVRVTVKLLREAKACDVVTPLPVPPSPKFQAYEVAFVDAPASNEQVKPLQV